MARCRLWSVAVSRRVHGVAPGKVWHTSLVLWRTLRRAAVRLRLSPPSDLPMPLNALVAATAAALHHAAIGRCLIAAITALSLASLVLNSATTTALTWETT